MNHPICLFIRLKAIRMDLVYTTRAQATRVIMMNNYEKHCLHHRLLMVFSRVVHYTSSNSGSGNCILWHKHSPMSPENSRVFLRRDFEFQNQWIMFTKKYKLGLDTKLITWRVSEALILDLESWLVWCSVRHYQL